MPTCGQCSAAITFLVIQYIRQMPSPFKKGTIVEPVLKFSPKQAKNCWICAKFLVWLEEEYQDVFRACHSGAVATKFSIFDIMVIKNTRLEMITFDIDLYISIEGHNENEEYCQYSVHLVPEEGSFPQSLNSGQLR